MSHNTPIKKIYSILNMDLTTTVANEHTRTILWRIRRIMDDIEDREDRINRSLTDDEIRRIMRIHIRQLRKCIDMCRVEKYSTTSLSRQLAYINTFFNTEDDNCVHSIISSEFENMQLTLTEFAYPHIIRLALWVTRDKVSPERVMEYIKDYYKYCVAPRKELI